MDEEDSASGLYRPHMEARDQGFDDTVRTVGLPSGQECEPVRDMDDSQLVGAAADADRGFAVADGESPSTADVDTTMEPMVKESGGGKRKRGRPPKGEVKSLSLKNKKEEEDVCFICFDGGSLVLCDRRGCPKAYHPSCIKRDEAFFKSKARWNCGWHICSSCQKAAHYMCYTCTYSLCKGCTKDADYLCVRGNMGFCMTCMRTIMLIENQQGNKETAQVDFDDKSSWEYLFKVYWIYLKGKLSLTLNELTQAKSPWKGVVTTGCQGQSLDLHCGANDGKGSISDSSSGCLESNSYKRRKTEEQPNLLDKDPVAMDKSSSDKGITSEWASKELLEFVAHMRNGDTSVLSQFDVQTLLLEYIKINNLRDPRRKSQIICDLRLRSIFGKPRVGHIEMLKLLEFHFLTEEDSRKDTIVRGNFVDIVVGQVEIDENNGNLLVMGKNKRRKNRKKGEERGPQTNLDDYAAIDVHNINLIFLRRNLMEILIEDKEFSDKVVGSIVRIRISSSDQKQEMYRLVQVVGTSKVAVPYKLGEKTADVMLEILNLDKKEAILIDAISNQEFSEDECQRLRQSIKCGLVKRFTVGNIQEKAMALRALKLNEWLDTEILRLNHLRDRASEKGHKKELRECVEKLQLLKTPEERQRRLQEIPEVHADPNMDPNYESEEEVGENNKKQDKYVRSKYSAFSRHGKGSISPKKGGDVSNDNGGKAWKNSSICGQNRKICTTFYLGKEGPTCNERKDAYGSNGSEKQGNQADTAASAIDTQVLLRSRLFSGVASETSSAALSTEKAASINSNETDKLWHYRDPNGKIQGPFCMVQLRKWSTTGYFPPDMRIWDINHKENESVLLADVLNGQFQAILPSLQEISLQSQEVEGASDGRLYGCGGRWSPNMNISGIKSKQSEGSGGSNDGKSNSNGNNELMRSNVWRCQSPNRTKPAVSYNDVQAGSSSQCWDSINGNNSCSDQPQGHSHLPSLTLSDHQYGTPSHQGPCLERERWNSEPNHGNLSSHETGVFQTTCGQSRDSPSNYLAHSGQSSGQNWKPENSSSNWNSSSSFTSVAKSTDSLEQNSENDTLNLPSPTPKTTNGDGEGQASENKQLMLLNVPNQDSHIPDLPSPTPKSSSGNEKCQGVENKQSVSSKVLVVPDSGPSWSSSSSLVVGSGAQVPEMADEWGRYSPTPVKPSIVELDVGLVSSSLVKAPDAVGDHAASPTSKSEQLTYSSPSHPTSNASSWQAIDAEPIEFSTLAEESVSDLLAQVDALESQCGLGSPTSVMNCVGEVIPGSRNDCFGSIEGLSPTPDPGKSDALSSTGDVQLPSQSTMRAEPVGSARGDVLDSVKSSSGQSFTKAEVNGETKPGDVPFNCFEAGSNIQPPEPSPACQNVTAGLARSEAMDTGLETVKRNADPAWGGPAQRSTCSSWGTDPGTTPPGNANVSRGGVGGSTGWEGQPKHGGDRITGSRNSAFHGGNPGSGRGRLSWGWQSSLVGGGYARPPPKGQRVCKFYEHGHCKKGASCDYLHP